MMYNLRRHDALARGGGRGDYSTFERSKSPARRRSSASAPASRPLHRRRHRPAMRSFCPPGAGGSTCSSRAWPSFLHHAGCIAIGLFALRRLWWTSRSTQSNLVWPPTSVAGSTLAVLLAVCLVCVAQRIVRPRTRANGSPTADHARDHGHHLHRHRRKPSEHGTRTRDRLQMHSCAGTS